MRRWFRDRVAVLLQAAHVKLNRGRHSHAHGVQVQGSGDCQTRKIGYVGAPPGYRCLRAAWRLQGSVGTRGCGYATAAANTARTRISCIELGKTYLQRCLSISSDEARGTPAVGDLNITAGPPVANARQETAQHKRTHAATSCEARCVGWELLYTTMQRLQGSEVVRLRRSFQTARTAFRDR